MEINYSTDTVKGLWISYCTVATGGAIGDPREAFPALEAILSSSQSESMSFKQCATNGRVLNTKCVPERVKNIKKCTKLSVLCASICLYTPLMNNSCTCATLEGNF